MNEDKAGVLGSRSKFKVRFWRRCLLVACRLASFLHPSFAHLRNSTSQKASKIASHDDSPSYSLDFDWNISAWDTSGQITYLYNPDGTLASRQSDFKIGSTFTPDFKQSRSYDANGNQIEVLNQFWSNGAWGNDSRSTTIYDVNGYDSVYTFQTWSGSSWTINVNERYMRQFNGGNQITQLVTENYSNGSWVLSEKIDYQFTSGVWSQVDRSVYSNGSWVPSWRQLDYSWHDFSKELFNSMRFQT